MSGFLEVLSSPNAVAALISVSGAILSAFGVIAYTGSRNNNRTASEKEVEARSKYVDLLQNRVGELEKRIDNAELKSREDEQRFWRDRREQEIAHRNDMNALERRYRHLTNALVQWAMILKIKLHEHGEEVPAFKGFDTFEEDGGSVSDQWRMSGLIE